jgi:hypothetical protein
MSTDGVFVAGYRLFKSASGNVISAVGLDNGGDGNDKRK